MDRDGYGRLHRHLAHRLVWEKVYGPIPEGLTVDHKCRRRDCINPRHMRLLTAPQNAADQWPAHKTHCKNNHELTPDNTYIQPSGHRACRECNRESSRRYLARKRAAA